jgi:UDP-glucose 4-epimerase
VDGEDVKEKYMHEKILIVGGAGYIGSHVNCLFRQNGFDTITYDNLTTGHRELVEGKFIFGDILDIQNLDEVFSEYKFDVVIHLAAKSLISESYEKPILYYDNNLVGTLNILKMMEKHNVKKVVFSSTASVYGTPMHHPVTESEPLNPDSVYGFTKQVIERMITDTAKNKGLSYIILRYFNAAGAELNGKFGELHIPETHLIPLVLDVAMGLESHIEIFGTDYDTPDGTCIRDYIHVVDVANAHFKGVQWLLEQGESNEGHILNVGSGHGFSVLEVIETARKITGNAIPTVEGQRRPGDPPKLVASSEKISNLFGWKPIYSSLDTILETAWNWHLGRKLSILGKTESIRQVIG